MIARTCARTASLLTSDADERDHEFLTGERTAEGLYRVDPGLYASSTRALAFAPYADLLWMETLAPDLAAARAFACVIHSQYPGKLLAYSCSPSFNWRAHLDHASAARFARELAAMGYRFQVTSPAGFRALDESAGRPVGQHAHTGLRPRPAARGRARPRPARLHRHPALAQRRHRPPRPIGLDLYRLGISTDSARGPETTETTGTTGIFAAPPDVSATGRPIPTHGSKRTDLVYAVVWHVSLPPRAARNIVPIPCVTFIRALSNALLDRGRAAPPWACRRAWRTVMGHDAPHGPRRSRHRLGAGGRHCRRRLRRLYRDRRSHVRSLRLLGRRASRSPDERACRGAARSRRGLLRRAEGRADLASAAGQGPEQPSPPSTGTSRTSPPRSMPPHSKRRTRPRPRR